MIIFCFIIQIFNDVLDNNYKTFANCNINVQHKNNSVFYRIQITKNVLTIQLLHLFLKTLTHFLIIFQFVSHQNVQQLLASIWYEGLPGFRRKNMALQSLEIIRIGEAKLNLGCTIFQLSSNFVMLYIFRNYVPIILHILHTCAALLFRPNYEKGNLFWGCGIFY